MKQLTAQPPLIRSWVTRLSLSNFKLNLCEPVVIPYMEIPCRVATSVADAKTRISTRKSHIHTRAHMKTLSKFSNCFGNKSRISDCCLLVADSKSAFLWNPLRQNVTNYCCSLSPYHSNPLCLSIPPSTLPHCGEEPQYWPPWLRTQTHIQLWLALRLLVGGLSCVATFHVCVCVSLVNVSLAWLEFGCRSVCLRVGADDGLGSTQERAKHIQPWCAWMCGCLCVCTSACVCLSVWNLMAQAQVAQCIHVTSACMCLATDGGMQQISYSFLNLLLWNKTTPSSPLTPSFDHLSVLLDEIHAYM